MESAHIKLGIIRNTIHDLNNDNFIVLYKSFVRPILGYCYTTWFLHYIMYNKKIEKVQWKANKLVRNIPHLPYYLIQVFRIIMGVDKVDKIKLFSFNNRLSRCNSPKMMKSRTVTSFKQYTSSWRVLNNWKKST